MFFFSVWFFISGAGMEAGEGEGFFAGGLILDLFVVIVGLAFFFSVISGLDWIGWIGFGWVGLNGYFIYFFPFFRFSIFFFVILDLDIWFGLVWLV